MTPEEIDHRLDHIIANVRRIEELNRELEDLERKARRDNIIFGSILFTLTLLLVAILSLAWVMS